jgi:seryl-tRNA synthetase
MSIEDAQSKFYELYDQWKVYHDAARELRAQVNRAFSEIASGGKNNPSLGILAMLESMEQTEKSLQEKMDQLVRALD